MQTKIISYEKKTNTISLKIEENQSNYEQSICHVCKNEFNANDKKIL